MMWFGNSIVRILGGFISQGLGVLLSVTLFSPSGTIFWWTQSAISMALMLHTPDIFWYERPFHLVSGLVSYIIIRSDAFPVELLLTVCACNGTGQLVGYYTLKYFFARIDSQTVKDLRFLVVFALFPVTLASLFAAIPGSIGFYFILDGISFINVFVNYFFGHVSGTSTILYPLLVIPALFEKRKTIVLSEFAGIPLIIFICMFKNYFLFGFTSIVLIYGIVIWTSIYTDHFYSSISGFISTSIVIGFTIARRGPFNSLNVNVNEGTDSVVIGTQMAITAFTLLSASVVSIFTKMRDLELSERTTREGIEKKIDEQMVNLFRIGHDLGNNSTLVKALCHDILDDGVDNCPELNVKIMDAMNTLNGVLISDMVDIVRCDPERTVHMEKVDIGEFIDIYVIVAKGIIRMEGKDITVTSSGLGGYTPIVVTNMDRLHQIMCNIVGNAVKYTERGSIELAVKFMEKEISICVTDTGIGIGREDVPKIFETFYRCERATEVNSGTGVGLSNAKKICEMIGANIRVSSEGEGKGSTFTLDIERRLLDTETKNRFSLRVLALDDSFIIRKLLSKYLSSMGCDVVSLSSVEEARDNLSDVTVPSYDVIITDGSMGGQSGRDFIYDIRRGCVNGVLDDIPCIVCSGENKQMKDDKNTFYMGKPFSRIDVSVSLDRIDRLRDMLVDI